jgi:hypothetical protein
MIKLYKSVAGVWCNICKSFGARIRYAEKNKNKSFKKKLGYFKNFTYFCIVIERKETKNKPNKKKIKKIWWFQELCLIL